MKFAKIKKLLFGLTATAVVAVSATAFAGCSVETDHPRAKITYEFNGASYEVEYTLYRNMYPQTVRHFIELADNGFYNDIVIHDYQSNDWITGGYAYNDSYTTSVANSSSMAEYFNGYSLADKYYNDMFKGGKLTASVYSDDAGNADISSVKSEKALSTLMGEYYNNISQEIEKGALSADYGSLKMFHYELKFPESGSDSDKKEKPNPKVLVTPTKDQIIRADYKNNCATSLFAIQTSQSSTYTASNYCVFATVRKAEKFDALVDAVKEYFSTYSSTSDYQTNAEMHISDKESDATTDITFHATKTPIKIKSVKITKY